MIAREIKPEMGWRTSEHMPRTVAMTPGPNIKGMARGTKAMSKLCRGEPLSALGISPPEEEGKKRLNPMRMRMMPPTMRTMLSGTEKIFSITVPNTRKKNIKAVA